MNDLRVANLPENRAKRPWIITYGHRPMYCSNDDDRSCKNETTFIRTGLPIGHLYGLEKLFLDSGVDVQLYAHQHSYERLWPIYNFEVKNGSYEKPYENAKAPVHIITGSAGCKEEHAKFTKDAPEWSAFRSVVRYFPALFEQFFLACLRSFKSVFYLFASFLFQYFASFGVFLVHLDILASFSLIFSKLLR